MANLNWGTGEQCRNILGNKGTKTILGVKKLGTREHKQIFKGSRRQTPLPSWEGLFYGWANLLGREHCILLLPSLSMAEDNGIQ